MIVQMQKQLSKFIKKFWEHIKSTHKIEKGANDLENLHTYCNCHNLRWSF